MKTLDEVINIFGAYSKYAYDLYEGPGQLVTDAFHYLKAFRDAKDALEKEKDRYAEAVRNCEEAENKYRKMEDELNDIRREHIEQMKNEPLTWDELKQMDMQPVWYESLYWGVKVWAMVLVQKESIYIDWYHRCQDGEIIKGNRCEIHKDQQGERWQAYRRERQ